MKTILHLSIFVSTFILSTFLASAQLERANEFLDRKEEVYFTFQISHPGELIELTQIISIDNVKGNDVWAYANRKEFNNFLLRNISYTVLDHPGDVIVEMWDDSKGIWDFDTYPTYSQYLTMMNTFATTYPNLCRLDTVGTTVNGRLLLGLKITDNPDVNENEPEFLYSGTMHGDETTGYILLLRLANYLLSNYGTIPRATNIVNNIELWIFPNTNPDGTYYGGDNTVTGARRNNGNNIDLNRNYPDPRTGQHPDGNAWQPENIAMMAFADEHDFVMGANTHGGAEVVNYPWDTWTTAGNLHADDNWWEYVSKEYADTAKTYGSVGYFTDVISSGYIEGGDWYVITGGRQDYMNYFKHCREVTLEISSTKLPAASSLPNYWNYNYRSMLNYIEHSKYGINGVITDACNGLPMRAKVYVESHDQANDSSHVYSTSNAGDYHRPIYAGTYSVTYSATGYQSQTLTGIVVTNKNTTVRNVQLQPLAPVANFSATPVSGCNATVSFTDITNAPAGSTFLWNFGDTQTSTEQNPTHTYSGSGNYTVTLTVTSCAGNDTETKTNYISITLPVAPSTTSAERCGPGSVSLSASGSGTLNWYNAASGGSVVTTGTTYTTPSLSATTNYYVESALSQYGASQNVGHVYTSGGATNTNQSWLVFDCFTPCKLVSVSVYTTTAGNRLIELKNSAGTTLQSATVNIPTGASRITLNFDIPVGTNLQLVAPASCGLYRLSSGLSYPYTLPGIISITTSSVSTAYYYYFFDWEIQALETCSSARTPVTATIKTVPTANAGNDVSITQGNSTTLTATGGGTYYWSTTATTASITVSPSVTTTYSVTVTGTNGCTATDDVVVTVTASTLAVTASASPQNICNGGSTQLNAAATGGSGYTYSWSSSPAGFTSTVQNPNVSPTVTTIYTVTVTSGANTTTSSTTVTVNPIPTANAGNDATICSGNSATLTATGGNTYEWSNSAGNTASVTVSPASSVNYTVTVTTTAGCTDTDEVFVTVNNSPVANAGNDVSVCIGNTATLTASGGNTYLWSHSLGSTPSVNANPTISTTYTVTVTASNGCTNTDQVLVTVNDLPVVTITGNNGICPGGQTTLTADGGDTYQWSDGLGTNSTIDVSPAANHTYYVTATDDNGCVNSASINIVLYDVPVADAGTDQSILTDESTTLNALATGGSGSYTYLWGPSSSLVSTNVQNPQTTDLTQTTVFTVTVTDAVSGCTDTDEIIVTITGGILSVSVTATPNQICAGSSIQLSALAGGGTGVYTYSWSSIPPGFTSTDQSPVISPTMNSVYSVTVNDGSDNISSSVSITVYSAPLANAGSDVNACPGTTVNLNASGGNTYLWSTGSTSLSIDVIANTTQTYTVTVTSSNGCTNTDDVTVTVYTAPSANAGNDVTVCEGQIASLTATGGILYNWSDGAGNTASVNVSPLVSTTYTVTIEDDNGCTATDQVNVNINPLPDPAFYFITNELNVVFTNTSVNASSYFWYFGDGGISNQTNPNYNYAAEGTYTVTLIATNSCGSDTIQQIVEITLVSNHGILSDNITMYPNPVYDYLFVEIPNGEFNVVICDVAGRVVFNETINKNLNWNSLKYKQGVYSIYILQSNSVVYRSRFVISR